MNDLIVFIEDEKDYTNDSYKKEITISSKTNNYTFSSKTNETNDSENKLLCKKCNKLFSTLGNLNIHVKTIHDNKLPFKCTFPNCQKEYRRKSELIEHERIHFGIKPFVCDICKKSFNIKSNLNSHFKYHSEIRPFKCSFCDKKFKINKDLKDHIKNYHFKIKKYVCNLCGKWFGKLSLLKTHSVTHTNEKKYQCKFEGCGKLFKGKRGMEKHYAFHMQNPDKAIKSIKENKSSDSKEKKKYFEVKNNIFLNQLDCVNNKNNEQIKTEGKKESRDKEDTNSIEIKENSNKYFFGDDKYYDDKINELNSKIFPNSTNSFPLDNLRNDSLNLNNENVILKDKIIRDDNFYNINNIYNCNSKGFNHFTNASANNSDNLAQNFFGNNDFFLENEGLNLDLINHSLREYIDDINDFLS